jgi:protein ImuB
MIVCVHLPRFELVVAAGGPEALTGHALAIAPSSSGPARLGEVSGTAQAQGVRQGMALDEALARCPILELIPGDPVQVANVWEQAARALEGLGALVELDRPGFAYFDAEGLERVHGGQHGLIAAVRDALVRPPRIGAGPTRFCALAAGLEARARRARVIGERDVRRYLAIQPVAMLRYRPETESLVPSFERLGIHTLGAIVKLSAADVADRFGHAGTSARNLALGHDTPLRVRRVEELIQESMLLAESNSEQALHHTLAVLIQRLLARPERRGRTIRKVTLAARLVQSGTWLESVVYTEADRYRSIQWRGSSRSSRSGLPTSRSGCADS